MSKHQPIKPRASLLERAAEVYDFNAALKGRGNPVPAPVFEPEPQPFVLSEVEAPGDAARCVSTALNANGGGEQAGVSTALDTNGARAPGRNRVRPIDREALREAAFIVPETPVGALAEEFRIVKRQLLLAMKDHAFGRRILVCSAQPDEGKTFCAVNLALSMAGEKDYEVLLVDADVAKPEVLSTLGIEGGPGLIDAIADASIDVEDYVLPTDVLGLSVLPAGRPSPQATELIASDRTRVVLDRLAEKPNRVILFDSPPALAASPAGALALHVGQVVLVVRADRTGEASLREAAKLLSQGAEVQLLLNGVQLSEHGRRYGYYGVGE